MRGIPSRIAAVYRALPGRRLLARLLETPEAGLIALLCTIAGFLGIGGVFAILFSGVDADLSLERMSATPEQAQVSLQYRVSSSDQELGPIRLFLDIEPTEAEPPDSGENAGNSLRASLMAGDKELATERVPLDSPGEKPLLSLGEEANWHPASGTDADPSGQVNIGRTERIQGFVLGRSGPDTVVEGVLTSTVSTAPLDVNAYVRKVGSDEWKLRTQATPGDRLEMLIRTNNVGETVLKDLIVAANLAGYLSVVPSTTTIINTNHPDALDAGSDNVHQGGIDIGNYGPGSVAGVRFEVQINPRNSFEELGSYTLRNVGIARPQGMNEFYNVATIDVDVEGNR